MIGNYLRVEGAADYLGLSKSTLDKMRVTGNGPPFARLGKVVVYSRDDLDKWVKSGAARSTAEADALSKQSAA